MEYKYHIQPQAESLACSVIPVPQDYPLRDGLNMDSYIAEIEAMPESVKKPFTKNSCNHCNFQGATNEYCKFRKNWTLDGITHDACVFYGFQFDDLDLVFVPVYWRLLELEYGLKRE